MGQKSVRFPDELQAAAERMAGEHERPFSWIVVKALEAFVPEAYFQKQQAVAPVRANQMRPEQAAAVKKPQPDLMAALEEGLKPTARRQVDTAAMERQRAMNKAKGLS
jgi:hypothetical protein